MILSFCIGCGCHEAAGCHSPRDPVDDICRWIRYDGSRGLGLCSACEDLVEHWDRNRHRGCALLPDLIVDRFTRQLEELYPPEERAQWIRTANIALDGRTPEALIRAGAEGLARVHALIDQIKSGAFR